VEQFSRQGLTFDVTDRGPVEGEAVVLLHGWPQDQRAFDAVVPQLTAAGLRVLTVDQRGYSPAALPRGRGAYAVSELVADVAALLDSAQVGRAHLVGHDWGGTVAWAFAERHPARLRSLTVLATPHHRAMAQALRGRDQRRRSWYMLAFQLPLLPELLLRSRLRKVLVRSGLPAPLAQRYAARFRQPGMARGGLGWYRALGALQARKAWDRLRPRESRAGWPAGSTAGSAAAASVDTLIQVPTTYVWGSLDEALGREAAELTGQFVAADFRFVEVEAGHWLPELCPDVVAREVLRRVAETSPGGSVSHGTGQV
jgi:pimeloyl-ACP methyl ester carboxylesterase